MNPTLSGPASTRQTIVVNCCSCDYPVEFSYTEPEGPAGAFATCPHCHQSLIVAHDFDWQLECLRYITTLGTRGTPSGTPRSHP